MPEPSAHTQTASNAQRTLDTLIAGLQRLRASDAARVAHLDADDDSAEAVHVLFKEIVALADAAGAELAFHAGIDAHPGLADSPDMADFVFACGAVWLDRAPREASPRAEHGVLHRVYQGV